MKFMLSGMTLAVLLSACAARSEMHLESQVNGATVTVWLTSVDETAGKDGSLVHGRIEIRGPRPLVSADLDCIAIATTTARSQRIYVDSFASVLTEKFPAHNGVVGAKVYWLIPSLRPSELDLTTIRLASAKSKGASECVKYSD